MFTNQHPLLASLVISALALGCVAQPKPSEPQPAVTATAALELTNYTWTVQYCQDPGDVACNYRNMEPGDEFRVSNNSGSKDATLILVKHKDLSRYEFKAAVVSRTDKQLVLNFEDKTPGENSCKRLTVNLIKEHGHNPNPGKTCTEQLQATGLKMSPEQIVANCAHPSVMDWSIVSTAAKPPNCFGVSSEFTGFQAMSPPDPGDGSGTGRN